VNKLPPYGKSIDKSNDTIWIWAGHRSRVYDMVKVWGKNTCAFFTWTDPQEFYWPVKGRRVAIVHFMAPKDPWIDQIAFSLYLAKASQIAAIQYRPNGHLIGEESITINHYA
jgi:hypothetical protein